MELTVAKHVDKSRAHLYCMGDFHLGSPDCAESFLEEEIKRIADDPYAVVILNGDLMQMDVTTSVGDVYGQLYTPEEQKYRLLELLEPLKGKIIAMQDGNHDGVRSKEGWRPIKDVAWMLGVEYTGPQVLVKLPVGRRANGKPFVYGVFATHGWGSARTMGGKVNKLYSLRDVVLADVYCMGHTHQQLGVPDVYYVPDYRNNKVNVVERRFLNSGSYQTRGDYPSRNGMPATLLGTPKAVLHGDRKKVEVTI